MSDHPIVHVEIPAKDPVKAAQFYKTLFDWGVEEQQSMDYVTFNGGEGTRGGFPRIDGEMYKPGDITLYIDTNDIEGTLKRIESAGGKTVMPKSEIPGMGWFALFVDPSGNRIGLFTANLAAMR